MINELMDVTSPDDWPDYLPELRNIDNLLRCSICKEFFDVAMLIQECGHNYCSLCIRQAINHKTQCPTCSVKVSCNDLKCNKVLDELVINFKKIRSKLLDMLNPKKATMLVMENKGEKSEYDSEDMFITTPRGKNIVPKRKLSKGKSPKLRKRKRPKVESDSDDSDYDPVETIIAIKQESSTPSRKTEPVKKSGDKPSSGTCSTAAVTQPTSLVECPVCGDMIDSTTINNHLDVCLKREEKKSSLRSKPSGLSDSKPDKQSSEIQAQLAGSLASPPSSSLSSSSSSPPLPAKKKIIPPGSNAFIASNKHKRNQLPHLVYNLMSDKELKQKLKQWNMSIKGNRQTLIKRHQEFVTIYNAECDSSNPKTASDIVKEMEKRAKQQQSKKFTAASTSAETAMHSLSKDSSAEEVDNAHKAYLKQHGDQFELLINNVRRRKKKAAEREQTNNKPSTSQILDDENQDVMIIEDTKECSQTDVKIARKEHSISASSYHKKQSNISETKDDNKTTAQEQHCSSQSNVLNNESISVDKGIVGKKQTLSSYSTNVPSKAQNSEDDTTEKQGQEILSSDLDVEHKTIDTLSSENPCGNQDGYEQSSSLSKENYSDKTICNMGMMIQDVSNENHSASTFEKQHDSEICTSQSKSTTVLAEPPSLSSLVFDSQIDDTGGDGERINSSDSSLSLGLTSDHEMTELNNDSGSDSELFRVEHVRSPTCAKAVRSLRKRKR